MSTRKDIVSLETVEGFHHRARAREHTVLVDEPVALGGTDLGPTPFELVASGLAGCTAITLRMYAGRKSWPLEKVKVRVEHEQRPHTATPEGEQRDRFERTIELVGPLDQEQRERLLEIANKCPVHVCLSHGATVVSALGGVEMPDATA